MNTTITDCSLHDIRFPTSNLAVGSDAVNTDPDYSAAYIILKTDHPDGIEGHGLTFTCGRGNEICLLAMEALSNKIKNRPLPEITGNFRRFWNELTQDSQLRWLGPEKGVIHLATAAVINAVWDLYAKVEKKPLWQLVCEMEPEELAACIDFSYISDVLSPEEAVDLLESKKEGKQQRIDHLKQRGYPAYTTSPGWLGYNEDKIRRLCKNAVEEGWRHIKMKVGSNLQDDIRRAGIIRDAIGQECTLMMDANQKWDIDEAIEWMNELSQFNPLWIEEPTNPDDILGHKRIREAIKPLGIGVATGEHGQNRILFKQLMQAQAIDFCQIDSCRVGGVNENLAIMLIAAKYNVPVCPHAGGVGLCEYVQHLSIIDYVAISGDLENRITEYVDHLHEHFVDPVVIKNAAYQVPQKPGYSITMKRQSIEKYTYPAGEVWNSKANYDSLK